MARPWFPLASVLAMALGGVAAAGCAGPPDAPDEVVLAAQTPCAVTIDATALSEQPLLIPGLLSFDSKALQHLPLTSGTTYPLELGNGGFIGYFTVSASGQISYDPALNNTVFTGNGSSILRVVPHPVAISALSLTPQHLYLNGTPVFTSTAVQAYQLAASTGYEFLAGGGGFIGGFGVSPDGTVSYDLALNDKVFSGRGSTTLGILPHAVAVDARGLTPQTLLFGDLARIDSQTVTTLQLPAALNFTLEVETSGFIGYVSVTPNGTVTYDPAVHGTVLTGSGTATVGVVPHAITVDATTVPRQPLRIAGLPAFDSQLSQQLQLPASSTYVLTNANSALVGFFSVRAGGTVEYDPAFDAALTGRGTATLGVVHVP